MVENLFDNIDGVFSADRDPVRRDFTMYGRPCYVEVRPMTAYNDSRFQNLGIKYSVNSDNQQVQEMSVTADEAEKQLHLMLWSISGFCFIRESVSTEGIKTYSEVQWPPTESAQKNILKSLTPALWRKLVILCSEANGLDPFGEGSDTQNT